MKNLIYLLTLSLMIFTGCAKDPVSDEISGLKNAKVLLPMKVEFCATPDMNLPPVACMPEYAGVKLGGGARISGHATHLGEIIPGKSYSVTRDCFLDGMGHIIEHCYGEITADSGDSFQYTNEIVVQISDFSFTGTIQVVTGNGRFEGVKGLVSIRGNVNPATGLICWTGNGSIWYE